MSKDEQQNLPDAEQDYLENYFRKIESLFATLRDRSLLLSPADYQLARQWYDRGIPLSSILRGIRAAFFKKMTNGDPNEEIHSLSFCRWAVMKEWKHYKSIPVEPADEELTSPEKTGDEVFAILDSAVFDLQKTIDFARSKSLDEMVDGFVKIIPEIKKLDREWNEHEGEIDSLEMKLQKLDDRMIETAIQHLDSTTNKKINKSVNRKLKSYATTMSKNQLDKTRTSAFKTRVRMELQLPKLTLYSF